MSYLLVLYREFGYNVIAKDIAIRPPTTTVSDDFLNSNPPEVFDWIVTNPPFAGKVQFLIKALNLGRPFAMLLPLLTLSSNGLEDMSIDNRLHVLMVKPTPKFLNKGVWKHPTDCAWFIGNFDFNSLRNDESNITMSYVRA